MKIEVEYEKFIEAVKLLDQVPGRTGYLCSYAIKMNFDKQLKMYLSSEVSAEVQVQTTNHQLDKPMELFLDRRLFFPFITAKVSTAPIIFSCNGTDELLVKQGRRKAKFASMQAVTGYAIPPKLDAANHIDLSSQAELIKCASSCAVNDPMFPQYSCVYMGTGKDKSNCLVIATNQLAVFCGVFYHKGGLTAFPFPLSLVSLQASAKDTCVLPKMVLLKFDNGVVWQSLSVKASSFPKDTLLGLLKPDGDVQLVLDSGEFAKILDRLSLYLSGISKEEWVIEFSRATGDDKVLVKATVQQAVFTEYLKPQSGKDELSFMWPFAHVIEPLSYMVKQCKQIKVYNVKDDRGYLIVGGGNYLAVSKKVKQ